MDLLAPWLWARYRAHYAGLLVFQLLFWPVFVIGIGMIAWAVCLHRTVLELAVVAGTFLVVVELCGAIALLLTTREARAYLNRWGRGDQTDPRGTRRALSRLDRIPLIWGIAGGVPMAVVAPVMGWRVGLDWPVDVTMGVAAPALVVGSGVLGWVIIESVLWPVEAELDAVLRDDEPRKPRRGVAGRIALVILLACVMGCWVVALLVSYAATDAGQYVLAPFIALPFAFGTAIVLLPFGVSPVMRPIRDLREATERIVDGRLDQRVPVTSDDEFGQLARSFNRMQAGLLERERLQSAFGAYVDPMLAQRLLERGSDLFEGEEVDATVVFIDVVGFTAFSQSSTAAETVARLNELFGIAVPILRGHGGHANKFLGDGLLAVFGVPEPHDDHADRAVAAATEIQDAVHARFGDALQVGVGIASGPVIAGTVGGGGKLEFTLVGDTVNIAARIEELTRLTGDPILLADSTAQAITNPWLLQNRGERELRGRAGGVAIHALREWSQAVS